MGEAKRRGTFEQRKSEAVKRADDLADRIEAQQRRSPHAVSQALIVAALASSVMGVRR